MDIKKHYDRFASKLGDLKKSTLLIDQALQECEKQSLKEKNLAKSIHIRYNFVAANEIFVKYINNVLYLYIKDLTDKNKIWNLIRHFVKEESMHIRLKDLHDLTKDQIFEKLIKNKFSKKEPRSYLIMFEKLLEIEISKNIREDVRMFWEVRHNFVHNDGGINEEWKRRNSLALHRNDIRLRMKRGNLYFPTNLKVLSLAFEAYNSYCKQIKLRI